MIRKKFNRKKFIKRLFWSLFIMFAGWVVNIIWFKPFFIELFYERMFFKYSLEHPEYLTQHHAYEKYAFSDYAQKLNDISTEQLEEDMKNLIRNWDMLKSYRFRKQTPKQQVSTKTLDFYWESAVYMSQYNQSMHYNYPINHINGSHISFIDFMLNTHEIKTLEDAENYLERLKVAPQKILQMMNKFEFHQIPPSPIIDKIIIQIEAFIEPGVKENLLYKDFQQKINRVTNLPDQGKMELNYELTVLIEDEIIPAYQYLLEELRRAKSRSVMSTGVWQLEMGDIYYKDLLRLHVTRSPYQSISADNLAIGIMDEMERVRLQLHELLDSLGYPPEDSLKYTIAKVMEDSQFVYQDTPEGKVAFLEEITQQIKETNDSVSKIFDVHVENSLGIHAMITHNDPYTSRLFYYPSSLDDYRSARLFINTDSIHHIPRFMLPALIHNYITPGEHFVRTVQHHLKSLPTFRRALNFDAYTDGWSFYAQRYLKEAGYYYQTPYEELGRLYQEFLRATAALTDYFLHKERYAREDCIQYIIDNAGISEMEAEAMVDRILVDPGRAFAYWAGYQKIIELREKAKEKLKGRYNLREFHQAILNCGPVPLDVLEMVVDQYINELLPEDERITDDKMAKFNFN
ncbi:MAG: DUF885 domain-containing protein [Flammeovirgaceae bacterium]